MLPCPKLGEDQLTGGMGEHSEGGPHPQSTELNSQFQPCDELDMSLRPCVIEKSLCRQIFCSTCQLSNNHRKTAYFL